MIIKIKTQWASIIINGFSIFCNQANSPASPINSINRHQLLRNKNKGAER